MTVLTTCSLSTTPVAIRFARLICARSSTYDGCGVRGGTREHEEMPKSVVITLAPKHDSHIRMEAKRRAVLSLVRKSKGTVDGTISADVPKNPLKCGTL